MTRERAEVVVGYPISITTEANGWMIAFGIHPEYKYATIAHGRDLRTVLGRFVDENYSLISAEVRREQGYKCWQCGRITALEIDHIAMRAHGRSDLRSNLRAMCHECHRRRHGIKVVA